MYTFSYLKYTAYLWKWFKRNIIILIIALRIKAVPIITNSMMGFGVAILSTSMASIKKSIRHYNPMYSLSFPNIQLIYRDGQITKAGIHYRRQQLGKGLIYCFTCKPGFCRKWNQRLQLVNLLFFCERVQLWAIR